MDIYARPLTRDAFAPFGDVLEITDTPDKLINGGRCQRFHNQATPDCLDHETGISLFNSKACSLPYEVTLLERHPLGSQAFIPMTPAGFLIIVAEDRSGIPATPCAFLSAPYQSINFHRNIWHGTLMPLATPGIFAVIDYIGTQPNLEEHIFDTPYRIIVPD